MAEIQIITFEDIREFYPQLSTNIDPDKITSSILQAQQNDLELFLGWYQYNDFIEDYDGANFATAKYVSLFKGGTYDYRGDNRYHRGIKHLLAVYSFARLLNISNMVLTESGIVDKITEESETREDFQERYTVMQVRSDSIRLEKDNRDFIEENLNDYPLYNKVYSTDQKHQGKTAYKFFKVIPHG